MSENMGEMRVNLGAGLSNSVLRWLHAPGHPFSPSRCYSSSSLPLGRLSPALFFLAHTGCHPPTVQFSASRPTSLGYSLTTQDLLRMVPISYDNRWTSSYEQMPGKVFAFLFNSNRSAPYSMKHSLYSHSFRQCGVILGTLILNSWQTMLGAMDGLARTESPGPKGHVQHMALASLPAPSYSGCWVAISLVSCGWWALGSRSGSLAPAPGTWCGCSSRCTGKEAHQGNVYMCVCVRGCVCMCVGARVPVGTGPVQVCPSGERSTAGRVPVGGCGQWAGTAAPKVKALKGSHLSPCRALSAAWGPAAAALAASPSLQQRPSGSTPDLLEHLHTLPQRLACTSEWETQGLPSSNLTFCPITSTSTLPTFSNDELFIDAVV